MERKEYGAKRSCLSILALSHAFLVCGALSFDLRAESPQRIKDDQSDARMNKVCSDLFARLDGVGVRASVMSQVTPDLVAKMFPSAPRANIERYLPMIRKALTERGLVDKMMVLMALATIRVETTRFDPISEAPSPLNTRPPGPPFNKYDHRDDLGNLGPPDGARFKGRGFIQLTGRKNYSFYGALLGYDLTSNPELANAPQPAAQILAAYLKENELAIRSALAAGDLATARRIVNGGANGLDRFVAAFMAGNQLIRDYDGDLVLSIERLKHRERQKIKDDPSISKPKNAKSEERRDDSANEKTEKRKYGAAYEKAKEKEDGAVDEKTEKKKDDIAEAKARDEEARDGKKKGKGFFLFRLLRSLTRLP